jgi:pimeloyl-ACP methyl ester carboxylesterase
MTRRLALPLALIAVVAAAVPGLAGTRTSATPKIACSGDPRVVRPLTLTVKGQPAIGLYAVPRGPPRGLVLLDHGYGHTMHSWRHHLARTAAQDRVIAVAMNYRGQVDSSARSDQLPTSRGWQVAEGAEDTIAAAQLFDARCPRLPMVVVYGVSMGGNTSGLVAATKVAGRDGRPLFDYWIDIEGATNVIETYLSARLLAQTGNEFAANAQADIEREMGGPIESQPDTYRERAVVTRAGDIKTAGIKGVVMVHGVGDGLVPYNQSREMAARLREVGVPVDLYSVGLRDAQSEPGTTIDGYVAPPGWTSPFAGHASETSETHLVGRTGFAVLSQLLKGRIVQGREYVVNGT